MNLDADIRKAREEDAAVLAQLVDAASHGMAIAAWREIADAADPPRDPWAVGVERQRAKVATDEIYVVDEGAGAIAGLTGYRIGGDAVALDGIPRLFRPLQDLENQALESWYVNVLATLPAHRGRGFGTKLLGLAERLGRISGAARLSLIVDEANQGARRLYRREGFVEDAAAPMAPARAEDPSPGLWRLMLKPL